MSRVSCCDSDEHIQKTIFKHKKKVRILDDNNISNIIMYENAKNGSVPPPIIRQSGYSSFLDTDVSIHMKSLSLLTCNA
ncbi:hypothetical protein PGAG_00375 [Phaeocystis globosa virus 12T]|uniref:Uncharacterized protein n=1 Tax=Phaeocystis globosa virus PgV-16T TaxID=3071227 RepID=A0AC59EXR5_9VIRU|nr:hypothetical protein PGCG_00420 [Phaeocystis globosa virus]AET73264.1 hypothetical protein PGAG_00375 [Phaeocystis globosa virus 12T]AET73669.1 hypothetical protein PGBG_00358 [Phaeocystis globosa virus 14T]AGM15724.1 hypothetical protein PGCG_00420 [Phaeocystis globosa virus PgV-16T]UYE94454.1 hypothetical protein PGV14T_00420 [Phaeocystis globosa virus]